MSAEGSHQKLNPSPYPHLLSSAGSSLCHIQADRAPLPISNAHSRTEEILGPRRVLHGDTPNAGKVKCFIESTRSQSPCCPEHGIVGRWAVAGSFPRVKARGEEGGRVGRRPVAKTEGTWNQDSVQVILSGAGSDFFSQYLPLSLMCSAPEGPSGQKR